MKERGILFSGPMVRAILDGTKSQTRRVVKDPDSYACLTGDCDHGKQSGCDEWLAARSPYGRTGDRLWVREIFQLCEWFRDHWEPAPLRSHAQTIHKFFAADGMLPDQDGIHWRPSIFMPRWASRITLEITGVRVERLQEISANDCYVEGIPRPKGPKLGSEVTERDNARGAYRDLWDSINGKSHGWQKNPLVWVLAFRKVDGAAHIISKSNC